MIALDSLSGAKQNYHFQFLISRNL